MIDLTGQTFRRLTVIELAGSNKWKQPTWKCRCECGNEVIATGSNLTQRLKQSCGCLRRDRDYSYLVKHGHTRNRKGTGEYRSWRHLLERCRDPSNKNYHQYGGRGIIVCERWNDFENFLADMGPKPSPKHSIDRWPNKNGNYEPGNCRWATQLEQADNKQTSHYVELDGYGLVTIAEAARALGVNYAMLRYYVIRAEKLWP